VTRIRIVYGDREYTALDEDEHSIIERIDRALTEEGPHWLSVVSGQGRGAQALLLVTPATPIAVLLETPAAGTGPGEFPQPAAE
jgi:hypothetical protein